MPSSSKRQAAAGGAVWLVASVVRQTTLSTSLTPAPVAGCIPPAHSPANPSTIRAVTTTVMVTIRIFFLATVDRM